MWEAGSLRMHCFSPGIYFVGCWRNRVHSLCEEKCGFGELGSYTPSLEKKKIEEYSERIMNGNLKPGTRDIQEKGNAGINFEEQRNSCLTKFQQSSLKEEPSNNASFGLAVPYTSPDEANGQIGVSGTQLRPNPLAPPAKQFHSALQNGLFSSSETQIRNGRPQPDGCGKNNLFPRYWPRFTDQDPQQITGDTNSVITPLFEKMLSASDAGRIGRLVLPKK